MNYRIFTLLPFLLIVSALSFGQSEKSGTEGSATSEEAGALKKDSKKAGKTQKDPVVVTAPVKFEQKRINGDMWIKATVKVRCLENPDAEKEELNPDWLRDVSVRLVCAFEDEKMSTSSNPKFVWFSSKATLFAMKKNSETSISFYIPWEAYLVYRVKPMPYAYLVDISANGKNYPINASNMKTRCNLSGKNIKTFVDKAMSNMEANKGVMVPYELAPFMVKYNDMPKSQSGNPTFIVE